MGRRHERAGIRQALGEARLVTLTGFGGIGKTRLALAVAADLRRAFADGTHFVTLGSLDEPGLLGRGVAAALGVPVPAGQPADLTLIEHLRDRRLLLILDNCEHLIEAAAVLTDKLLRACPRLRVLATSREPLRISGEAVHPVGPLVIPAPGRTAAAQHSESEQLFADRARAVLPHFTLTPGNRAEVAGICRQLQGIPLAIELAAGRLRSMALPEISGQLAGHWAVLSRGSRAAPARQHTMAACVDWSFGLCSAAERDMWAGASVFTGSFGQEAAEAVCAPLAGRENVADLLAALVDKSVIAAEEGAGHMRYRLLPPVRHRGQLWLAELGLTTELQRRHRDWCVSLALRAGDEWLGPGQAYWIERLSRESGNLQSALRWCLAVPGEAEAGLCIVAALSDFVTARGLIPAGQRWLQRLLPLAPEPSQARALALRAACWWSAAQGDLDTSARLLREAQRLAQTLEPARSLLVQAEGLIALLTGETERSIALFDQAIAGFRTLGNQWPLVQSLGLKVLAHAFLGQLDMALDGQAQCYTIITTAGELCARAYSLWIAGYLCWRRHDDAGAIAAIRASLQLGQQVGDPIVTGLCFEALAWTAVTDSPERAATLLGAAARQRARAGIRASLPPGLPTHHQDCVQAMSTQLDPDVLRKARDHGASLGDGEATGLALGTPDPREAATAAPAGADPRAVLTPRQSQVARLVASGLGNREIAEALVISRRTAETHVENILSKLGFTARHQITAWMSTQPDGTEAG